MVDVAEGSCQRSRALAAICTDTLSDTFVLVTLLTLACCCVTRAQKLSLLMCGKPALHQRVKKPIFQLTFSNGADEK